MALHRDIFWVGKQWAVTGYGMQAVDQKQKSKFDIEASRVWEDDLLDVLSNQRWFNAEDFNTGLSVARAKYPEAPAKAAARKKAQESTRVAVAPLKADIKGDLKAAAKTEPKAESPKPDPKTRTARSQAVAEPAKPAPKAHTPKPEAAPAPSKLALTGGSTASTIKVKTRADRKRRPVAQIHMPIGSWPAKFTPVWRVRLNRQ
jgi:outer membrane biosynthesis protein TonB